MVDCCVLLWWDYAILFVLCSNIRIHDNQNGKIANSPQKMFNNAPPPAHLMDWQKMKDCRFWDAMVSLVGKYIVRGDSASITEHQFDTVCCDNSRVCLLHSQLMLGHEWDWLKIKGWGFLFSRMAQFKRLTKNHYYFLLSWNSSLIPTECILHHKLPVCAVAAADNATGFFWQR
jgi:hypothetical protein